MSLNISSYVPDTNIVLILCAHHLIIILGLFLIFIKVTNRSLIAEDETEDEPEVEPEKKVFRERHWKIIIKKKLGIKKHKFLQIVTKTIGGKTVSNILKSFRDIEPDEEVVILLNVSTGGTSSCALQIARQLVNHPSKVHVIIPERAVSAGSFLAMCADTIYLGKGAWLTPFDDQFDGMTCKNISEYSFKDLQKLGINLKLNDIDTLKETKISMRLVRNEVDEIFGKKHSPEILESIRKCFIDHDYYHTYPFDKEMLSDFGIETADFDDWMYEMWDEYPKPKKRKPE